MQQCFCIKGVPGFDFYLKTLDTQTLVYNALSEWMTDEPYVIPETHEIEVTLPDSSVVILQVSTQSTTVIKAADVGIGKFKDGIYCLRVNGLGDQSGGCGHDYTKIAGVFPNIECCIDTAYSKLGDDKFYEIRDVESWLNRAKGSSSLGKEKQALDEWNTARRLLNQLNCECSC